MDADVSDCGLVVRARLGDRDAFNLLVGKYRHRVMKLSLRYTRNRADAEDVVQETFIRAYGALSYFRGDAAFYSWLHRIAVNSAKTAVALRVRQSSFMVANGSAAIADDSPEAPIDLDTPEDLALTEELCGAVNAAVDALSEQQRTAIALREFQGLSYSHVAEAMSCPVGTVRSRIFRAREAINHRLRHILDDQRGVGNRRTGSSPRQRTLQMITAQPLPPLP